MERLGWILVLIWGIMRLTLLSYERVQRICEFACGHGCAGNFGPRFSSNARQIIPTRHLLALTHSLETMDATFERMIAQAVRGNQAASPPQEPTVPDKCVLSS
jgi:hypothetical protein